MAAPKPLSPQVSAASQLLPQDISALVAQGFASIINNRPDDEEAGQPSSAEIEAAAVAAGLSYLHAPVRGMPDEQAVAAVADRLKADSDRGVRTLMFCRSGMRSTVAWAIAQRQEGADPDSLREVAAAAGYDLSRLPL